MDEYSVFFYGGPNENEKRITLRKSLEFRKRSFAMKKFDIDPNNPLLYVSSQWQKELGFNKYYFLYRCSFTTYFLITLIISIIDSVDENRQLIQNIKWPIYFTHWSYATSSLQSVLSLVIMILYRSKNSDTAENGAVVKNKKFKLCRIYWIGHTTCVDIACSVTACYWLLVHNPEKDKLDAITTITHILNCISMLFDFLIVAHPVNLLHFYWPVLYVLCYICFSIIYYLAGGTTKDGDYYIYKLLDWTKPEKTAIICASIVIFIIVVHFLVYCGFLLRQFVCFKFCKYKIEE